MTREEFETICRRIFGRRPDGYGWRADMHQKTGIPKRTLTSWSQGEYKVPAHIAWFLTRLDTLTQAA